MSRKFLPSLAPADGTMRMSLKSATARSIRALKRSGVFHVVHSHRAAARHDLRQHRHQHSFAIVMPSPWTRTPTGFRELASPATATCKSRRKPLGGSNSTTSSRSCCSTAVRRPGAITANWSDLGLPAGVASGLGHLWAQAYARQRDQQLHRHHPGRIRAASCGLFRAPTFRLPLARHEFPQPLCSVARRIYTNAQPVRTRSLNAAGQVLTSAGRIIPTASA